MSVKKNKKKRLKKKFRSPKEEEKKRRMPTENAKMIYDLMVSNKVKGKYKDHVIIAGSRLIDWLGAYDISVEDENGEKKTMGVNGVVLIHKCKLAPIIGEEMAKQFWHLGRRTNHGVEARRSGCIVKNR